MAQALQQSQSVRSVQGRLSIDQWLKRMGTCHSQVLLQGLAQGEGYSGSTVYVGVAGIALAFFRLHECLQRGSTLRGMLDEEHSIPLGRAAAILQAARRNAVSFPRLQ